MSESIEQRRKGTLLCFTKTLVSKKIMDEEEGGRREGVPEISVKKPLSQSAEKFRTGTLLCCVQKFSGSENFMDKKKGNHFFPSKLFCLNVPNLFVEEPFCVPANFRYRKVFITKRVIESLLSHSTE